MVFGEGKKPSGEEVSIRLLLLALLEDQEQTNILPHPRQLWRQICRP
jgi:hypothetical protein